VEEEEEEEQEEEEGEKEEEDTEEETEAGLSEDRRGERSMAVRGFAGEAASLCAVPVAALVSAGRGSWAQKSSCLFSDVGFRV